jgi:hypothetical protein
VLAVASCSKEESESPDEIAMLEEQLRTTDVNAHPESRYFQNKPLPVGKKNARVLCIGNSYTNDAVKYVTNIMDAADISDTCYTICVAAKSSASLQLWWERLDTRDTIDVYRIGRKNMPLARVTLKDLLAQPWDIITLQQYSGYAVNYGSFNPWLRNLIDSIRTDCPNPDVTLAWQTAPSYSEDFGPRMDSYERWVYISLTVQKMVMKDGIDVLIPIGTAIQNARNTTLNTASELTRDGTHLDLGVGCYIASCTWVQALMGPVFGISVSGNEAIPPMPASTADALYPSQPVTASNRELCQRCATAAVESPFSIVSGGL